MFAQFLHYAERVKLATTSCNYGWPLHVEGVSMYLRISYLYSIYAYDYVAEDARRDRFLFPLEYDDAAEWRVEDSDVHCSMYVVRAKFQPLSAGSTFGETLFSQVTSLLDIGAFFHPTDLIVQRSETAVCA